MSVKVTDTTAKGQIQFIQNHQTPLDAGEYKIEIQQAITIDNINDRFTSNLTFVVQGNRFELKPEEIHAVFPPAGSFGDRSHLLPHIALKSSTLPWERLVSENQDAHQNVPWLALILIHEEEKLLRTIQKENILETTFSDSQNKELTQEKKEQLWQHLLSESIGWIELIDDEAIIVEKNNRKSEKLESEFAGVEDQVEAILAQSENTKIITLKKLQQTSTGTIKWPGLTLQTGQQEDDKVSVIDVPKKLLSEILPTINDLEYLAHVRQVTEYDLNLIPLSSVDDWRENESLKKGKKIVIVAKIGDSYYVRIFDDTEIKVIDREFLPDQKLKEQLEANLNTKPIDESTKTELIQKLSLNLGYKIENEPLSLVISDRLPKKEGISTAYLVSLEDRYNNNGEFNYQNATDEDYIRLVVLKSWSFSCTEPEQSFTGLLKNLNLLFSINLSDVDEQTLNQEKIPDSLKTEFKDNGHPLLENSSVVRNIERWDITDGNKHYSIEKKNNRLNVYDRDGILRLPKNVNADAEQYLTKGYIPLPHYLRQGGKTFSWYHSPLVPGKNSTNLALSQLSVRSADQLISYNPNTGLFDISWSALRTES